MSTVVIPTVLRPNVGGVKSIEIEGGSIRAVVDGLVARHPALRGQLLTDDGELNRFVNVYVNGRTSATWPGSTRRSRPRTRSVSCRRWQEAEVA
jgi:molybdopterin converting factor small subunit